MQRRSTIKAHEGTYPLSSDHSLNETRVKVPLEILHKRIPIHHSRRIPASETTASATRRVRAAGPRHLLSDLLHLPLPPPNAVQRQAHSHPVAVFRHTQLAHLRRRQHIAHAKGALHHLGRTDGQVAILDGAAAHGGEGIHDNKVRGGALGLDVRLDKFLERGRDERGDDDASRGEHGAADKVRGVREEGDLIVELEGEAHKGLGSGVAAEGVPLEDFLAKVGGGDKVVDLYFEESGEDSEVVHVLKSGISAHENINKKPPTRETGRDSLPEMLSADTILCTLLKSSTR